HALALLVLLLQVRPQVPRHARRVPALDLLQQEANVFALRLDRLSRAHLQLRAALDAPLRRALALLATRRAEHGRQLPTTGMPASDFMEFQLLTDLQYHFGTLPLRGERRTAQARSRPIFKLVAGGQIRVFFARVSVRRGKNGRQAV